jgi:hypothetical protein
MKALRKMLLIATATALVATAGPAWAQDWAGSGRVKGVVTDTDGKPVAGAQVIYRMLNDPESGPPPMVTNKKGKFSMLGLKGGSWTVRVEAEGYYPWITPAPVEIFSTGVSPAVEAVLEALPQEVLVAKGREEANQFLKTGDELMDAGDAAAARAQYEQAIDVVAEVDYPVIYSAIANTYLSEGNLEAAEAKADEALAIDEDWVAALKVKCAIAAAEGRLEDAEALLGRIPNDEVINPNTLVNLGLAHFNRGEMEQAVVYFDRTTRDHPDFGQVYYFRGLTHLNLSQTDAARADFQRFLELEPDSPQAAEATEYLGYLAQQGGGQ